MKQFLLFFAFSLCMFLLNAQKIPSSHSNAIFTVHNRLDCQPEFPGGLNALGKFLSRNLKWPSKETDVQGKVIIGFIVEKDGRLTNFKIERKLWPAFDKEALRVIKLSPKWIPAMQNGKPVRCQYSLPINFTLSE